MPHAQGRYQEARWQYGRRRPHAGYGQEHHLPQNQGTRKAWHGGALASVHDPRILTASCYGLRSFFMPWAELANGDAEKGQPLLSILGKKFFKKLWGEGKAREREALC